MKRNMQSYDLLLNKLQCQYALFDNQGLEGWIFCISDKLLKIYQGFIISDLALDEELRMWMKQEFLLSIYAPNIEAYVVKILENGIIKSIKDVGLDIPVCYGIIMKKAIPFQDHVWEKLDLDGKSRWAEKIGKTLADFHANAPKITIPPNYPILKKKWIKSVLDSIWVYDNRELFKNVDLNLLANVITPIDNLLDRSSIDSNVMPTIHGDASISNIVLGLDENVQFVDCGPSLPFGAGIANSDEWLLDNWWDVAMMSKHLLENGGEGISSRFQSAYHDNINGNFGNKSTYNYWNVMVYLLVIAVCLRRWDDFHEESNPFQVFLTRRKVTLESYINYYIYRVLDILSLPHPLKESRLF